MSHSTRKKGKTRDGERSRRSERENVYHDDTYRDRTPRAYDHANDAYLAPENVFADLRVSEAVLNTSPRREEGAEDVHETESSWGAWSDFEWTDQHGGCWYSFRVNSRQEYEYRYDQTHPRPVSETPETTSENYATYSSRGLPYGAARTLYGSHPAASESTSRDSYHSTYPLTTSSQGSYDKPSKNPYTSTPGPSNLPANDPSISNYVTPGYSTPVDVRYTVNSGTQLPPRFGDIPFDGCPCGIKDGLCGVLLLPPDKDNEKGKKGSSKHSKKDKDTEKEKKNSKYSKKSVPHSSTKNPKQPARLHITVGARNGPNGDNCGPLTEPAITPSPMPRLPPNATPEEEEQYHRDYDEWYRGYQEWSQITCPCGLGYFNVDGLWISGADVRAGRQPPNPLWMNNGGRAPDITGRARDFQGQLFERGV